MYFTVVDHYEDFQKDDPLELNECLICLEVYVDNNVKTIDLKTQQLYLKKCECGGWIHLRCLCEWHEISNSCPICRLYMKKSDSMISIFSFNVANFYGTCILLVFRLCFVFWFMFSLACSYHIYKSYFILKSRNHNDICQPITE